MNRTQEEVTTKYLEFEKMFPPFIRDLDTGLCIPEVAEGWEWCFDWEQTVVLEKLNGTNTKLVVEDGVLEVFARNQKHKGYVPAKLNDPQYKFILQGVANSIASRKKKFNDGTYYGELVGPKYENNPYKLDEHKWMTFEPGKNGVERYKDHPQSNDFNEWKEWVLNLKSLLNPEVEAEGIIFLNKKTGQMAKLRKDMFSIEYNHRFKNYSKNKNKGG